MENLLDKEQNLDQPILAELPIAKVSVQPQLPRVIVNQRVVHLRLEVNYGHGLRVVRRERDAELEHCILIDALLAEVDALPVGELGARVVW